MTTKKTNSMIIACDFVVLLYVMIIGSFVVSFQYIDLAYLISFIIFLIKILRLDG